MYAVLPILAESLASDNLWTVLVFLATLAMMAGLKAMGGHIGGWRHRNR